MAQFRSVLIVIGSLAVSGCATRPPLQTDATEKGTARGVDVISIVEATKCELGSIAKAKPNEMMGWSAKVALDLKVIYDNSGGPGGGLIVPYHGGTVDVTAEVAGSAQSNRAGHLAYLAKLDNLKGVPCPLATGISFSPKKLGLSEWLQVAVGSVSRDNDFVDLAELTYTLEFVIERSATGEVRVRSTTAPTTGSVGIGGKASSKDTNTLLVSLVPPMRDPGAAKIEIVNWPSGVGVAGVQSKGLPQKRRTTGGSAPRVDPYTQQRLDDLQLKQRWFNSITIPRGTLGAF